MRTILFLSKSLILSASISFLFACSQKSVSTSASQLAAKVNKGEISVHQVNFASQGLSLAPDQLVAARKSIVDKLVEQEIVVQQAIADQLDRDPEVLQRLDASRREILARSYVEKMASKVERPQPDEIEAFFKEKPELFSGRKIFRANQIVIDGRPSRWNEMVPELGQAKSLASATAILQKFKLDLPVIRNATMASESLPIELLPAFEKLTVGEVAVYPQGQQIVIAEILEIKPAAVTQTQAGPVIEQFIMNRHRSDIIKGELKRLKASAQVAYLGEFAQTNKTTQATSPSQAGSASGPSVDAAPSANLTAQEPVPNLSGSNAAKLNEAVNDEVSKGIKGAVK
jgi:EpsD family peptidyl-prolyl cis-trans isomerase